MQEKLQINKFLTQVAQINPDILSYFEDLQFKET